LKTGSVNVTSVPEPQQQRQRLGHLHLGQRLPLAPSKARGDGGNLTNESLARSVRGAPQLKEKKQFHRFFQLSWHLARALCMGETSEAVEETASVQRGHPGGGHPKTRGSCLLYTLLVYQLAEV